VEPIRVLIAYDHTLFRDGLRPSFGSIPEVEVEGEGATGDETVAGAAESQPDIVLMWSSAPRRCASMSPISSESCRSQIEQRPLFGPGVMGWGDS